MRGHSQDPPGEKAPSRDRAAGEHPGKEGRIEPGGDGSVATRRHNEPSRTMENRSGTGSPDVAAARADGDEQRHEAEQRDQDDEEALWRKSFVAAILFCIVAALYFALFSVMQTVQIPGYSYR